MAKKHNLSVPGRYEHIQQICQFVADGAAQAGMDESAVFHVELACDEACTNIIEHAYGGEDVGEIEISWLIDGDNFTIVFKDKGRPFDPDEISPPSIPSDPDLSKSEVIENLQVGGLGIHFIRKLMDEVRFEFNKDGNTLILVKNIVSE